MKNKGRNILQNLISLFFLSLFVCYLYQKKPTLLYLTKEFSSSNNAESIDQYGFLIKFCDTFTYFMVFYMIFRYLLTLPDNQSYWFMYTDGYIKYKYKFVGCGEWKTFSSFVFCGKVFYFSTLFGCVFSYFISILLIVKYLNSTHQHSMCMFVVFFGVCMCVCVYICKFSIWIRNKWWVNWSNMKVIFKYNLN